jgi:hypothetical protein
VQQEDLIPVQVDVPSGTAQLVFELSWEGTWGRYPTNDLDMLLLDPDYPASDVILNGATYDSPERVVIDNPADGVWTAYVQGFTVRPLPGGASGEADSYVLRVTADGKRLAAASTQ